MSLVGSTSFTGICGDIRLKIQDIETKVVRDLLVVADLLAAAKTAYENETGTGHGKRNPARVPSFAEAAAAEIGKSPTVIHRLLKIGTLDPVIRTQLLEGGGEQELSQTVLLLLARESDVQKRSEAVSALERDGAAAMREVLDNNPLGQRAKTDPQFEGVLRAVLDRKEALGGIGDEQTVPEGLKTKFDELSEFDTMGQLRIAVRRALGHGATPRSGAKMTKTKAALPPPPGAQPNRRADVDTLEWMYSRPAEPMGLGQLDKLAKQIAEGVPVGQSRISYDEATQTVTIASMGDTKLLLFHCRIIRTALVR